MNISTGTRIWNYPETFSGGWRMTWRMFDLASQRFWFCGGWWAAITTMAGVAALVVDIARALIQALWRTLA